VSWSGGVQPRLAPLVLCLCACSSSPLVRPDDRTFHRSAEHFRERMVREVSGPPAPDETLFLQAEALYHYRFELRRPSAATYGERAVAAFVEFSPLNALAASQGIDDLRLAAYNGAAQLYEAVLLRYPDTKLRPLVLWRLGWTYRSTSIGGFPRDSDAAFDALHASSLASLAAEARRLPWKSQNSAVAWSVIPGAGQMYAGQVGRGFVYLGVAAAFTAAIVVPVVLMAENREVSAVGIGITLFGIVGLQVTYTDAYQDAQRAALEFNERHEEAFDARHPEAP
jgi:TM2 domain-containing membrane protein YozV